MRSQRSDRGFTLVELLVVIGIIALLLAILLPTLGRAQETARQAKCLSNLKQLSQAMVMYCNDNKGYYPGRAGQGTERGERPDLDPANYSGWIAWRRRIDPVSGVSYPGTWNHNITYSSLGRYLGRRVTPHATPEEANRISASLDGLFRCPSDDLQKRVAFAADLNGGRGLYRYSYSMNIMFGNKKYDAATGLLGDLGKYRKFTQVKRSSEVVLLIDESELSINNGENNPTVTIANANDPNKDYTAIAERHETSKNRKNAQDARGNVAFADGHAAFFGRAEAFKRRHFDPDY
jgi:prepilin-type N-terminal cleavage/methylation domain-containing protein/prepilin-type processing-associated H-X9-DG protein